MNLAALRFAAGSGPDTTLLADQLARIAERLATRPHEAVTDVVASFEVLQVEYDRNRASARTVRAWVAAQLDVARRSLEADTDPAAAGRTIEVPVRYDGPDLDRLAERAGVSRQQLIALHTGARYRVRALGFAPGFPFLDGVPPPLQAPRAKRPRSQVPAHSVAVAGKQAGIYPLTSPGGWRLLGRALVAVYDPHREEPFLLRPGDRVRFREAAGEPPPEPAPWPLLPEAPAFPTFHVEEPGLLDLTVDAGRLLVGRYGLARTGASDLHSFRAANRLLAQAPDTPALEFSLRGPLLRALRSCEVAVTGGGTNPTLDGAPLQLDTVVRVPEGALLVFPSAAPGTPAAVGARNYLAIKGGLQVRPFLGSASSDVRARIGMPLQGGEVLGAASLKRARPGFQLRRAPLGPWRHAHGPRPVRIVSGPHRDADAFAALLAAPFRVANADRTGVRLVGATVPGGEGPSEPTLLGGVQVPPAGEPIVLLHDRGSLGGYRTPAQVVPADLAILAQLRPGETVRFRAARRRG